MTEKQKEIVSHLSDDGFQQTKDHFEFPPKNGNVYMVGNSMKGKQASCIDEQGCVMWLEWRN